MCDNFTEKFFKMEKDFNLFSIRTKDSLPIWDIIRYRIAYELESADTPNHAMKKNGKNTNLLNNIVKIKYILVSAINLIKPLNENLFFLTSRNIDLEGSYFDVNADTALSKFNKSNISIIETYPPDGNYKYKAYDIIYHYLISMFVIFRTKKQQIPSSDIADIERAINFTFSKYNICLSRIIRDELFSFRHSFLFYNWLFKKNKGKLKRVFVTQNGIQKGLFLAAHYNGIRTFEFQHGIINKTHKAYNYNFEIKYQKGDLINSDILFTFSRYWSENIYHPFTHYIPIGNNYFSKKLISEEKNALTVVSSVLHNIELQLVTKKIAQKYPSQEIYYKLHPNQFWQENTIKDYFSDCNNVNVIRDEISIQQLIVKSKALLLIVSTALYEALHNSTPVCILAKVNYLAHVDVFSNPNVYLINSLDDFTKYFYDSNISFVHNSNIYFQSFDANMFNKCLITPQ